MTSHDDSPLLESGKVELSRRELITGAAAAGTTAFLFPTPLLAALGEPAAIVESARRFPYFQSTPVSYLNVRLQDTFWAPRQKSVLDVSLPWATRHLDSAGGLEALRKDPQHYASQIQSDWEAVAFLESLAVAAGLKRDATVAGLVDAWGEKMIASQEADGYWPFGWTLTAGDPAKRWKPVWWSHEDYALGFYVDAALTYREATGNQNLYNSAVRAADNMAATLLGSKGAYLPGHPRVEMALVHLYGETGDVKYLQLCSWLIGQRGHHEGRRSFGRYSQDHLPVEQQRTIEGHAVRAAFLFNGVTEYVGATGHAGYREAVLAVWQDFVDHKMYFHGPGGLTSASNEGYSVKPDFIPPDDCYGESCAVFGNFQWAHSLFRLTGDASYIDVAERMLYNAFYASLSLQGDRYFYENVAQQDRPTARFAWHPTPCCPPNIVKLFAKVGGFFYSTDRNGIFVKHYGASEAQIPFAHGVKLTQRTQFPWDGDVTLRLDPERSTRFALRLRVPDWAKSHAVAVNGAAVNSPLARGWLVIEREWKRGDTVALRLPMAVERVTMPARFKEYQNLAALQRGPIVYCLEEQDLPPAMRDSFDAYVAKGDQFTAEHRPELLGGVTVLRGNLHLPSWTDDSEELVPVTFTPYGVWDNRTPGAMRIWLPSKKPSIDDSVPSDPPGAERANS